MYVSVRGVKKLHLNTSDSSHSPLICFRSGAFTVETVGGDGALLCHNAGRGREIINYHHE